MTKAFNLLDNREVEFDKRTTPQWAVAYAYCEQENRLSWLFQSCLDNDGDWQKLPFQYGKHSVALGDWAAKL